MYRGDNSYPWNKHLRQEQFDQNMSSQQPRKKNERKSKPLQHQSFKKTQQVKKRQQEIKRSTSPYRATGTNAQRPPPTDGDSLELLGRFLQRENNSLVEQIDLLIMKSKKVNEIEQKTELILKHNDRLLRQNEALGKLINQKKNEVQTWKNKFESLSVSKTVTFDPQNRKLLNQIQKLKEQITDIEHMKNMQISQLKNQNQNLKRHHLSNNQKYELQIRKLKEYCEKKEYEISDLNMQLVRLSKETDFEIGKLREEKEKLRSDLIYQEAQHQKDIDSLSSEMEKLKKKHIDQVEALDYQNTKLKEVINSKNLQIEQIYKLKKMLAEKDQEIANLKKVDQEIGICKICLDKAATHSNQCGHLCVCFACSRSQVRCPLCRTEGRFREIFYSKIGK